jgi:pyruvate,water dikinase
MFNADAILYRFERGLNDGRSAMAVGCIRMVDPRCSGIMFSREFDDVAADRVVISSRPGLNVGITSGAQGAEEIVIGPESDLGHASEYLGPDQLVRLRETARRLEAYFGGPQDIEWAFDPEGRLIILQCRPMVLPKPSAGASQRGDLTTEPLLSGGMVACPGTGSGPVYIVGSEADLERFPSGGVVVARHSSPSFSRVMTHCSAIITEIGSPIGHMAILAREFGVPSIVGMKDALNRLTPGQVISVDATHLRVYEGQMVKALGDSASRFPLAGSPAVRRLRRVARLITPLSLTDPSAPEFKPSGCRSLHDITRFVHEKVYEVMFHLGDHARSTHGHSFRLEARLPLEVRVLDVGGGIAKGTGASDAIPPSDIRSVPMQAFLEGLMDPRIKWDEPRPVSARGFMSVMGENIAGPPALSRGVGGASFAVISDRYMNFSTKAGYHFSTLDVYCGQSQNKNYIHFKFHGGGASLNRRLRRINFLVEVLTGLEFKTQTQGDLLVARLDKYEHDYVRSKLAELGRLTMCVRQLDMLMDSDAKASALAQAFLRGDFSKF